MGVHRVTEAKKGTPLIERFAKSGVHHLQSLHTLSGTPGIGLGAGQEFAGQHQSTDNA